MATIVFYLVALAAVISAIVAVTHKNPVFNVLSLVVTFFCVAVNYALLGAHFLAAAQILIYAGAILVLFLFVIMLLGAPGEDAALVPRPFQRGAGLLLAILFAAGSAAVVATGTFLAQPSGVSGGPREIGRLLIGPYLFAFELISVLLLAALVGALVLVRRKD